MSQKTFECNFIIFTDMNECLAGKTDCPGQCINIIGSYTCNCTGIVGYLPGVNRPCKGKEIKTRNLQKYQGHAINKCI